MGTGVGTMCYVCDCVCTICVFFLTHKFYAHLAKVFCMVVYSHTLSVCGTDH